MLTVIVLLITKTNRKMLRNLAISASLLMVVGSQSFAAEQIMVCKARGDKPRYYKLVTPFFGKAKVERKRDGNWLDWCDDKYETVKIYETAARCNYKRTATSSQDRPKYGIEIGMQITREISILIDFEFATRIVQESLFLHKEEGLVEIPNWDLRQVLKTYTCENKN